MIEIKREVEQMNIMGKVVDLKPITKASINKIKEMGNNKQLGIEDFEEILKIGIGEDAFREVFPDDESMDMEIMIKASLAVYEKFLDNNLSAMENFSNKYNPNRAARRASKK